MCTPDPWRPLVDIARFRFCGTGRGRRIARRPLTFPESADVDRLIELTSDLPVEEVSLDDLSEIDSVYWFDDLERPTVRKIVDHVRLVEEVDPTYPIIVGPDNRVMDGMHRVGRALLEQKTCIRAVRLRELPDPDYRGCRPDELPYDR